MLRKIITIDEKKCNGCGACAAACHEGAIEMINGKAKLTREDYADFCDESCRLLTQTVRRTGDRRCLDIFEYLEKQRSMLIQNPSLTALAGALAAFCGKTV